ncbi:nucleotidyltransferase family protein [Histidinibacterium lentulum]|uniref:Nucleotidyltransferase family protein n=1 Tax=Histidinibacterium lentulum TaxID=2480588 RepID=A0A3N2R939_9RHOB|nr:nucleotidyltransferase family protein [Histidinibacterium lentulum]ROU03994.1 nucleotidyltransferase family protein [Histidinibacterium lentulum]
MTEGPLILIPAAGASSRMRGADKLTRPVEGVPLLGRQVAQALGTGWPVLVTLPPDRPARTALVLRLMATAGGRLRSETLADANEGLSRSLRAGALAALEADRDLLVMLPDMPGIETADLQRLVAARTPGILICRATAEDGTPGHPVLFAHDLLPEFAHLYGDHGAAAVVRAHREELTEVPLEGRRACEDLDSPEDWEAFLSR